MKNYDKQNKKRFYQIKANNYMPKSFLNYLIKQQSSFNKFLIIYIFLVKYLKI